MSGGVGRGYTFHPPATAKGLSSAGEHTGISRQSDYSRGRYGFVGAEGEGAGAGRHELEEWCRTRLTALPQVHQNHQHIV